MNDAYDQLVSSLNGIPSLPGALCRGRSWEFDTTDEFDAEPAIEICRRCTALDRCREWARGQPLNSLNGVVGGDIYEWVDHPSRRRTTRKAGAA